MRQSVLWRFITAYLIFFFFGIIIINYYASNKTYQRLTSNEASSLYGTANTVNNIISSSNNLTDIELYDDAIRQLTLKDSSSIIISSTEGNVFYTLGLDNKLDSIPNLNFNYFNDKQYAIGNFFDVFNSSTLTVYLPIERENETIGYIFVSTSTSYITYESVQIVDIFYVSYFIIMIASCILIMTFIIFAYLPLKEIRKATNEYAQGNFSYNKLKIGTNDEMGDIAASLVYMAHQLNNTEEYQKKFISNISHDFRSPLTSIKGYVEAIIDGTIPYELQNKYLNTVLSEANRLEKLTNGLINLSGWGNKQLALIYEDFDIDEVIHGVMESFEGQGRKKGVTIFLESRHHHMVYADQSKIQQVLYNLIDNAMKFSKNNTCIKVSLFTKADRVYCSIKDSGTGISQDEITKIWDRFYKTDSSRGKDKTGSGIGLSIVKEIINAHNQTIDVISTEGFGTEFIFSLEKSKKKKSTSTDIA